ncbi:MAG TPA: S8 family peptidase [Actinomycetota bacterium]|nr:S8 family peptidase [Actinomycetota bacterium]
MTATALRTRTALVFALFAGLLAMATPAILPAASTARSGGAVELDPALSSITSGDVNLIVRARPGAVREAVRAVTLAGGAVTKDLPIVNGFAATVPASEISGLARVAGVYTLTLDRKVAVSEGGNPPSPDSVYRKVVKADTVNNAGYKGQGITVAVVDTGITEVADLNGRIVDVNNGGLFGGTSPCKNFSGESTCNDTYGHGTFIAGIIAGNGAASGGEWKGVAPQAKLLSVKIAGSTGAADVSTLLAALQWIVSYRSTYNIKVVNLSLGTNGTQSYRTDPLNYAVQKVWDSGVVVVVSAGNLGPEPGTISKPGDDPWVITVGATDDQGTNGIGDDTVPNFSAHGPTAADGVAKPDVAAPGGHIVSLRAPGSEIDTRFPNYIDGAYRKGSGTSMSAAVVSGTAALMIQRNPSWTPNRVKYALVNTARQSASNDPMAVGSGVVDAYEAAFDAPSGTANAGLDRSSGLGSLDLSRGTVRVQADDVPPTLISGLLTLQLLLFDPVSYIGLPWTPLTWSLSQWNGAAWYGAAWYGAAWYGAAWYGAAWYGQPDGAAWYGAAWYGGAWYGAWE